MWLAEIRNFFAEGVRFLMSKVVICGDVVELRFLN